MAEMTVGMREALQYADVYSAGEIAEIAAELDYLYQFDELPPGAVKLAQSERQGDVWVIVWPEPGTRHKKRRPEACSWKFQPPGPPVRNLKYLKYSAGDDDGQGIVNGPTTDNDL